MKIPTRIEYLTQLGVLDKGPEAVALAVAEYKRLYKRESKKLQRKRKKEYRPMFTKEEVAAIQAAARAHKKPVSTYVHAAAMAYTYQKFLIPNPELVRGLEQVLKRIYFDIRAIKERHGNNPRLELLDIMRRVEELEKVLTAFLKTPPSLISLVRDAIATSPTFRSELISLLNQ
jgi:hypothetical protein